MNVYIECGGSLTLKDRDTVIIEKKRLGFYQACFKGNERHRVIWSFETRKCQEIKMYLVTASTQ